MRASGSVVQDEVLRNAQRVQHGGGVIVRRDGIDGRIGDVFVAGPIHRTAANAPARE